MFKKVLLCALSLSLLQCTAGVDEPGSSPTQVGRVTNPYERTAEQAVKVVRELLFKSEFRAMRAEREIAGVVDLSSVSELRSTQGMSEFSQNFYAVEFKDNRGYAIVSKDLRTFPVFAVLDKGSVRSKDFTSPEMQVQAENMLAGFKLELKLYEEEQEQLRGNSGSASANLSRAREVFLGEGWIITREAEPRLETEWGQTLNNPELYLNKNGALFRDVYGYDDPDKEEEQDNGGSPSTGGSSGGYDSDYRGECDNDPRNMCDIPLRSLAIDRVDALGCTPVAFGQVMYALRDCPGFNTLKYDNGERVKWHLMGLKNRSDDKEVKRFLGWITANCAFKYTSSGTIVFNIKATEFLREKLGHNIVSRYDNCVFTEGDFDGYGWSEDRRIAEEFFEYPKCFVIMTASSSQLNLLDFHTYVVDGMIEFKKTIKGSGLFGWGIFRKTRDGVRHLYHVNAGWDGASNGYFLYVQNVDNIFNYYGTTNAMDYRSNLSYLIVRPR